MMTVNVIGAGLAGCEASYQLAKAGVKVNLYEMKPRKKSPAHKSDLFAELVCSNSLKAQRASSAAGLLKEEMRLFDSLLLKCADVARVPAGGALAVDRDIFSKKATREIINNPYINVIHREAVSVPAEGITIVATGPLTSDALAQYIYSAVGSSLSFFDAAAPIVALDSIDMSKAFYQSRYDKGGGDDYLNCPLSREEYDIFYQALVDAQRAPIHNFDVRDPKVYEGCMPIEVMARRGYDTLRFGPMKPVGLTDPNTGHRPWAVVQLRKENAGGTMLNLVGFQTNLKFSEQKRVFGLIPALKNAEFVRYGVMHRNTFLNSPSVLNADFSVKNNPNIFFAGQITGVEGYMESAASGILAGINAARSALGKATILPPETTMMGSLARYIADPAVKDFQPMGANFGILPQLDNRPKDKKLRGQAYAQRSLTDLSEYLKGVV